jgi:hypothetical protein
MLSTIRNRTRSTLRRTAVATAVGAVALAAATAGPASADPVATGTTTAKKQCELKGGGLTYLYDDGTTIEINKIKFKCSNGKLIEAMVAPTVSPVYVPPTVGRLL